MNYLFVAKTGVLDALAVALGYLGTGDLNSSPFFGDLQLETSGHIIRVAADANGNEVFIIGNHHPIIADRIQQQLERMAREKAAGQVKLIPISSPGDTGNWYLMKLAKIPVIGTLFLNWGKARTLSRKHQLFQLGRKIRLENDASIKTKDKKIIAAKPL